jgi:hypothetical protein
VTAFVSFIVQDDGGDMRSRAVGSALVAAAIVMVSAVGFAQTAVDLTGTWAFTVETSAGAGMPTITLKQDGAKLTGHYSGQLGEADLMGSLKGGEFVFEFTVEAQGMQLLCTYTGTAESKDSLKGTMTIAGLATGAFTAKRQ